MKSTRVLALVPLVALGLAGCGGSTGSAGGGGTSGGSAATGDCGSAEVLCVGLVTDMGKVDDKSFNQSAWEGVEAAKKAISGTQTKYIETTDTKDYAANMKKFTDAKYDAIVTVGFLMAEATAKAAKDNPTVKFIGVDQDHATAGLANLTGLVFPEDQAGYAAGYLAAKITKTNKLGQVLGMEIPPVQKFAKGFEAGAKKANPAVGITTVYHPPGDSAFTDPTWGATEARKQLDQGADVIFGAGGKTGNGALAEIAKAPGAGERIYCIGVDTDQWNTVPEAQKCLVTSATKLIAQGTTDLLKQVKDGSIKGGDFTGKAALAPYHDFDAKIPANVKSEVDKLVADLKSGAVTTGVKLG